MKATHRLPHPQPVGEIVRGRTRCTVYNPMCKGSWALLFFLDFSWQKGNGFVVSDIFRISVLTTVYFHDKLETVL